MQETQRRCTDSKKSLPAANTKGLNNVVNLTSLQNRKNMSYAPIIIFAFNRLDALRNTVESLRKNTEAAESNLYVFVDGARPNKEGEDIKVRLVQDFVANIYGFKSLHYTFSKENKGLGPSIIAGVTEVINQHGEAIVLEDDLEVAPGFLSYMNTMLDAYETDQRIMQIAGYSTKISLPRGYKYDIYLNRRGESWSWATWADRWNSVDWEVKDYPKLLSDKKAQQEFNNIGSDLFDMLRGYMEGRNKSWAVRFCYAKFKKGCYQVSPVKSLIRNEGFNADATNCKSYNRFKYELNDSQTNFTAVKEIPYVKSIDKSANKYWSLPFRVYGKVMTMIKQKL